MGEQSMCLRTTGAWHLWRGRREEERVELFGLMDGEYYHQV